MAILPQLLSKLIRDLKISPKIITSTLIICAVFSSYNAIKSFPSSNTHMQLKSELIPFKACKKVSELNLSPRHGRDHIRILTHFNHGNWCRWLAYEQQPLFDLRVTTDSRTQWVADEQYTKSFNAYLLKPGWLETLNTWSPDVALLYKSAALAQMMILAKDDWQIVHEDENFALFIPRH